MAWRNKLSLSSQYGSCRSVNAMQTAVAATPATPSASFRCGQLPVTASAPQTIMMSTPSEGRYV